MVLQHLYSTLPHSPVKSNHFKFKYRPTPIKKNNIWIYSIFQMLCLQLCFLDCDPPTCTALRPMWDCHMGNVVLSVLLLHVPWRIRLARKNYKLTGCSQEKVPSLSLSASRQPKCWQSCLCCVCTLLTLFAVLFRDFYAPSKTAVTAILSPISEVRW